MMLERTNYRLIHLLNRHLPTSPTRTRQLHIAKGYQVHTRQSWVGDSVQFHLGQMRYSALLAIADCTCHCVFVVVVAIAVVVVVAVVVAVVVVVGHCSGLEGTRLRLQHN